MFVVGHKVVYPSRGPCLVGAVVRKVIAGQPGNYYLLTTLDDAGDSVLVPLDKMSALGIRRLMTKSELARLLGRLALSSVKVPRWHQRAFADLKRLRTGSACDLADLIELLTDLNERRPLGPYERQALVKARRILICARAEVAGESKHAAEERLDHVLEARKQRTAPPKAKTH